jgi:ABC-2 type transport system permease protein
MMREPRALPFAAGAGRILELALGEMLWSRRTVFMTLLVAAPVVLAAATRLLQGAGSSATFGVVIWVAYLGFIVPVLGVFYGTSLMADEVDDRTITYLFTRPIRRGAILAGKYLAYLTCTTLMVLPSALIAYFLIVPGAEIPGTFLWLLTDLGVLTLGLAVYGGVFALVGAALQRPVLAGLLFVFGWEPFAVLMPGALSRFTVTQYLQALVPHTRPPDEGGGLLLAVFTEPPGTVTSLLWLGAILATSLWLAMRTVESREYVLDQ